MFRTDSPESQDFFADEAPLASVYIDEDGIDEHGRDEYGRECAERLAEMDRWEADFKRRVALIPELDAAITRGERDMQRLRARRVSVATRFAWLRFKSIARRTAARRFIAAASRELAADRCRPVRTRRVERNRARYASSRASSDDPAAAIIAAALRKAVA